MLFITANVKVSRVVPGGGQDGAKVYGKLS